MGTKSSNEDSTNDDIDDIIYKGAVPSDPSDHDSFFGSDPEKGQQFTVHEGQEFVQEED